MDPSLVEIRRAGEDDSHDVWELVRASFDEFVAPDFPDAGVETFRKYMTVEALRARLEAGHFQLVAATGAELAGVIEIRERRHISLLFVDRRWHRRGIARALLDRALAVLENENPGIEALTVNSSPYAVSAYERLGFAPTGPQAEVNGILHVPMALTLGGGAPRRDPSEIHEQDVS